jgi:endo-1,3(4)-beta-glucanase
MTGCTGQDVFLPVGLGAPPANIAQRGGHPAPRTGIQNMTGPISTNKFYANFFLGSQGQSTWTQPYSIQWSRGGGNAQSWGMAISHIDPSQRVFGPPRAGIPGSPASYYINPIGIQSIILSAAEMRASTVLTSDSLQAFSANINLQPAAGSGSSIKFPVVQGMGFVTGVYNNLQPAIQSSVFFRNVAAAGSPRQGVFKYRATLEDGKVWLVYAIPSNGVDPNFQLVSSTLLQGLPNFSGAIQIAKNPTSSDSIYDNAAGAYPTSATISGYANGNSASYSLAWSKGGPLASSTTLLMFALPHHVESLDGSTRSHLTGLTLQTTTKGIATAIVADSWTLTESNLPTDMGFAPWKSGSGPISSLSGTAIQAIQNIAAAEVSQNMGAQTNLDSMYFSGKGLSKFATIIYVMNDLSDQKGLAAAGLANLKAAFKVFVDNQQRYPLVYDTDWKGVVSSATYVTGDPGVDFGNSFYNDHHFHYGYFIHAAAIIGYLDPSWLAANKDYVNTLVRDASNPSAQDTFFPVSRSFDWYNGHSWAKGLFESADGKDQESSSEDAMFAYGLKMWGKTIGDHSMEARGNLMLSVLTRSFKDYFLLEQSNVNQPSNFIGNKVTGIMFENKIDHTTYFGANLEYIQG